MKYINIGNATYDINTLTCEDYCRLTGKTDDDYNLAIGKKPECFPDATKTLEPTLTVLPEQFIQPVEIKTNLIRKNKRKKRNV